MTNVLNNHDPHHFNHLTLICFYHGRFSLSFLKYEKNTPYHFRPGVIYCSFPGCGVLPTPKEVLPAATQTGANTFGCLVNGKVWLPKGNNGTSNLSLSYDPILNNGTFDLRSYRYPDNSTQVQYVILSSDSLSATGIYPVKDIHQDVQFSDSNTCRYYS